MSDTTQRKAGVATRPLSNKEAPLPLEKRGKGKMPAAKRRQKDAVLSKPGIVSAPPAPAHFRRLQRREEGSPSRSSMPPSYRSKPPKSPQKAANSSPSS